MTRKMLLMIWSYLEQNHLKMTEEFQKDLTVQQLGSKLVVNLWLMDGIVFEKINTAAVKSSNIKIRGRAKNRKKLSLWDWDHTGNISLWHVVRKSGALHLQQHQLELGETEEGNEGSTPVIFRPGETTDWRHHREPQSLSGKGRENRMIVSEHGSKQFCLMLSNWTKW